MRRTFDTTAEQDAAIAWRVAQIDPPITEDVLIAGFVQGALATLVKDYRDHEASRVFEAYKVATVAEQAAAKAALRLE